MQNIYNLLLFVTILLPFAWTIYVPEHTKNNTKPNGGDHSMDERRFHQDLRQTFNHENDMGINNKMTNDGQKSVFLTTNQTKITKAHHSLPIPRNEKSYDINDDVVVNASNRTIHIYENLEAQPTSLTERQQHEMYTNDVLTETINKDNDNHNTLQHHTRRRRHLSDFFIAPNTRWCGRGNTANGTYNHLGGASMADKCCRTHDHCKFYIPAMSNRYDLFNYRPYTLSHCNCDRRFRTCLKMANDEDANTIGKLFFNLVQTQCFVLTKKEVTCQQRSNDGTCLKEHIKQKAYLRNNKKY